MKNCVAFLSFFIVSLSGQAQINAYFVLSPMGAYSENTSGSISHTVGEMSMVSTFSNGGYVLTQGFQQGYPAVVYALPITLLSFAGYNNGNINHLDWQTQSEINNEGFNVERMDAAGEFDSIGYVRGSGTTPTEHSYSLDDRQPLPDVNYYRLKQKDLDGHFTYSNIISISSPADQALSISIYPVPTSAISHLTIYSAESSTGILSISDLLGNAVHEEPISIYSGVTTSTIDLSAYPQGQYFVRLTTGALTKSFHIVKE